MSVLSPIQYRLSVLKKAIFGDDKIIGEVLVSNMNELSDKKVGVSWERDGEFIVGTIFIDGSTFMTQAHSAKEFVGMVNDAIYAVYGVTPQYAEQLGNYRLVPSEEEFKKLNDQAIKKSSFNFNGAFGNVGMITA